METVVLVGIGMTTAVGLSAAETSAAVRAGVMRFESIELLDKTGQPFTTAAVPADALPPLTERLESAPGLTSRERRMVRLASGPLRECLSAALERQLPAGLPPLCLALPETPTTRSIDGSRFVQYLLGQVGRIFDAARSDASQVGRAGGLLAISRAVQMIRSGLAPFVVAGGVDTYRDPYVLGSLDVERRVKSATNIDGFIPAEGAAFVLLASARAASTAGLEPLARVSTAGAALEPGHLYSTEPYKGDGLAAAVGRLLAEDGNAPFAEVYSSMNGEAHWAKEWGVARTRHSHAFDPNHDMHHPADCFGDTGAAVGPAMVGLAALGARAGFRRSPALVYGSSDRGPRAAICVTTG